VFRRNWSYLVFPGVAFAAVMGLTNTSLSLTSVNLHVLLRTTMIIWCVFFAWLIEGERPSLLTLLACLLLAAGAILASYQFTSSYAGQETAAIILTLLSAVAQGILLVLTRRAARVLGMKVSTSPCVSQDKTQRRRETESFSSFDRFNILIDLFFFVFFSS
jgi:drug/metabolite transporter (DMT)-like permease